MVREIPGALVAELSSPDWRGARGSEALGAAFAVALAVVVALAVHSDQPWWAGISAFMVTRAARSAALSRSGMRVVGSVGGALVGIVVLRLFAYQQLALVLSMFGLAWTGLYGFAVSRYGYAWLIAAVTGNLVILMALSQPQEAFTIALNRVADVAIGSAASFVIGVMLPEPTDAQTSRAPLLPERPPRGFWRRSRAAQFERWLGENWPLLLHACRGGLTVMMLPFLMNWLAPLTPTQVGVTAVAVMSIPTTAIHEPDGRTIVQRAVHRVVGCILGASAGLACLAVVGDDFVVWLFLLMAGIWLATQIQAGAAGVGYVGTQAGVAFLMSMVQGQDPPTSITPGLDRLAGMAGGLTLLLVITLIFSLFQLHPAARRA